MSTLQTEKQKVIEAFNETDEKGKKLLRHLFGDATFQQNIKDRVKSFEDACKVLDLDPSRIILTTDSVDEAAYKKLKTIIAALNEGWTPDWNNSNQTKYVPWFESDGGSGLVCHYADGWFCDSLVGSRLCLKSADLAAYVGKQFHSEYNDFLTIK